MFLLVCLQHNDLWSVTCQSKSTVVPSLKAANTNHCTILLGTIFTCKYVRIFIPIPGSSCWPGIIFIPVGCDDESIAVRLGLVAEIQKQNAHHLNQFKRGNTL